MTSYSVIYAFGDSLSDAGNAWLLTNSPYALILGLSPEPVSPPYYQEVYNNVTADVFSDGPVWTQDLSSALGLGTLAPSGVGAFANTVLADLTAQVGAGEAATDLLILEALTGVSGVNPYIPLVSGAPGGTDFAVGGAVTGPTNENSPVSGLDGLDAQLATFQHDVPAPAANALATVSIGGNDVFNILEDPNFATLYGTGTTLANVAETAAGEDIAQSVNIENAFLGSLIATGVSNAVVMNVPDIGLTPEAMDLGSTTAAAGTVLAEYYNELLSADITSLNTGSVHFVLDNALGLIDDAVANPGSYGLSPSNLTTPVYTGSAGTFTPADLATTIVSTQDTYLYFDKEHPTETGEAGLATLAEMALTSCFATGTRIRTADGELPVEQLRIGAPVVLADGETTPVVWIGRCEVDCAGAPDPGATWPVRVCADAFGPGLPVRDLYLSPDHAVFIDGVLIPVKHLIDGVTIAAAPRDSVTWWHVELPGHAVLLAEGLPCESYLDIGGRDIALARRKPRAGQVNFVWETRACAELVVSGPRLEQARRRVRALAA